MLRDRVRNERAVRDDERGKVQTITDQLLEELRDRGIVLGEKNQLHGRMSASMRRKRRSDTQTLHLHMGAGQRTPRATSAGMADAQASGVKHVLRRSVSMFTSGCVRFARWAFGPVDEEHVTNVIPMPGPAHGPVPAIDVRLEHPRRKAS